MELYQLRGFVAVAELEHLTRAAERLHLSQPALSAQIKALEDELGVQLFERNPAGMTLTAAGKHLLPDAARVLEDAAALHGRARAIQGEVAGHVRVGTLADPEFIRLADFLAMATERFPLIEIELHHEVSGAAFEKVRDGELDASFYYGDLVHPAVTSIPLREIRLSRRRAGRVARTDRRRAVGDRRRAAVDDGARDQHAPGARDGVVRRARERAHDADRGRQRDGDPLARRVRARRRTRPRGPRARGRSRGRARRLGGRAARDDAAVHLLGEKREEPEVRALVGIIGDVWHDTIAPSSANRLGSRRRARAADRASFRSRYSGSVSPDPPISFGRSFIFGSPSYMRRTVSW